MQGKKYTTEQIVAKQGLLRAFRLGLRNLPEI